MSAPLNVQRNKYYENVKSSTIYTPPAICEFIYDIVSLYINPQSIIFDTSVGSGNLLAPFMDNNYKVFGVDIHVDEHTPFFVKQENFLLSKENENALKNIDLSDVGLVVQNPPFNNTKESKEFLKSINKGKALLPELFLDKIWELFGNDIPCVSFVPMGFRLNQRCKSTRWTKIRDTYPRITSIISLPLDIFDGVEFHNEILIFNLPELQPHYFVPDKYIF